MTKIEGRKEDLPKIMATIGWTVPPMVFRLGVKYLRMKRQARRAAMRFRAGLEASGMPPELASRLADTYSVDLSIHKMLKGLGIPFIR
jgi:hypothetical protein